MAVCGKCIHKNVCDFCKEMGFENVVRANDFNCKDYISTADVVEVCRCGKCKYANEDGTICRYSVGREVEPTHYCSYGVRKNENSN